MSHRQELLQKRRELIARRRQLKQELDAVPEYNGIRLTTTTEAKLSRELRKVEDELMCNSFYLQNS